MLLGFDIGGTKCAVILGAEAGGTRPEVITKKSIPTSGSPTEMIRHLFSAADELMEQHEYSREPLDGIGISCGGPLSSKRGMILAPPNLPGWDNIPIVDVAQKHFGVRTTLQNDANACAVAEWKYGAGMGYDNVVFLTFGTGMGAGLILDGKLYSGTTDLAGEVGHMRLAETGPAGFGKAGSFEGYCSGGGIAQLAQLKAREQLQMGKKVSFCPTHEDLPGVTAKIVAEAARQGDPVAIEVYKICGFYLGRGIAMLIDLINPQVIILGSIYGRSKELMEPFMLEVIGREALTASSADCSIVAAGLGEAVGDYAALSLAVMAAQERQQAEASK